MSGIRSEGRCLPAHLRSVKIRHPVLIQYWWCNVGDTCWWYEVPIQDGADLVTPCGHSKAVPSLLWGVDDQCLTVEPRGTHLRHLKPWSIAGQRLKAVIPSWISTTSYMDSLISLKTLNTQKLYLYPVLTNGAAQTSVSSPGLQYKMARVALVATKDNYCCLLLLHRPGCWVSGLTWLWAPKNFKF